MIDDDESSFQSSIPLNSNNGSYSEDFLLRQTSKRLNSSSLSNIVRPDLDRLDQMIGKLQKCTKTT